MSDARTLSGSVSNYGSGAGYVDGVDPDDVVTQCLQGLSAASDTAAGYARAVGWGLLKGAAIGGGTALVLVLLPPALVPLAAVAAAAGGVWGLVQLAAKWDQMSPEQKVEDLTTFITAGIAGKAVAAAAPGLKASLSAYFNKGRGVTTRPAQRSSAGPNLSGQLTAETAASVFDADGTLSDEALAGSREIIPGSKLNNPRIPPGVSKFGTETYRSPSGDFQVHFYMNPTTREPFYGLDYKAIFNDQGR